MCQKIKTHIIKTTASIPTKFCKMIKTTKYFAAILKIQQIAICQQ